MTKKRLTPLPWKESDAGRAAAGFKGDTTDCTCRAFAHATGRPYAEVYEWINRRCLKWFPQSKLGKHSARLSIPTPMIHELMRDAGATWTPTMRIGSGCQVHLAVGELPDDARLVVLVSRHTTAVIDGVVWDTYDPTRDGTRCVYGFFRMPEGVESARLV